MRKFVSIWSLESIISFPWVVVVLGLVVAKASSNLGPRGCQESLG